MPEYEIQLWKRSVPISWDPEAMKAVVEDRSYKIETTRYGNRVIVEVDGKPYSVEILQGRVYVNGEEQRFTLQRGRPRVLSKGGTAAVVKGAKIKAPIPGRIVSVDVKVGDSVKKGQGLLVLEAMKMQNEVTAPVEGLVKAVHVKPGQTVDGNFVLVEIE